MRQEAHTPSGSEYFACDMRFFFAMNSRIISSRMLLLKNCLSLAMVSLILMRLSLPARAQHGVNFSSEKLVLKAKDTQDNLQKIAEDFLDLLDEGKYQVAYQSLHPNLQQEWSPEILQTKWENFQKWTGKYKRKVKARTDGNLVLVKIECERVTDELFFLFDENDKKIVQIDFPEQNWNSIIKNEETK